MNSNDPNPVPSRQERKACHSKRDAYYKCLDEKGIDDPAKAGTACQDLRKLMYDACPDTWADYFEKLRAMKKKQERIYQDQPAR